MHDLFEFPRAEVDELAAQFTCLASQSLLAEREVCTASCEDVSTAYNVAETATSELIASAPDIFDASGAAASGLYPSLEQMPLIGSLESDAACARHLNTADGTAAISATATEGSGADEIPAAIQPRGPILPSAP